MRKTPTRNHRSLTKAQLLPLPADQVQRSSHMMHDFARCQRIAISTLGSEWCV